MRSQARKYTILTLRSYGISPVIVLKQIKFLQVFFETETNNYIEIAIITNKILR